MPIETSMASTALLALALLVQQAPDTDAVILSGVVRDGRLPLHELGLGDGGLGRPVRDPARALPGQHVTTGGVLVRAQREGVKLDFPSGAEVLMAPSGVIHVRDGNHSLRSLHAMELWLTDGSRVRAIRSNGVAPFRQVEVINGARSTILWRRNLPLRQRAAAPKPSGTCYLALGPGDVLYQGTAMGPLIVLQRAVCPNERARTHCRSRLVIAGDPLAESLRRLPRHIPPQSVELPHAPRVAAALAQLSSNLFPTGHVERPTGAVGALVFGLTGGYRLGIDERPGGPLWLGLYRGAADVPMVEWRVEGRTTLHFVRPEGGRNGLPRYYLRGIDLTDSTRELLPVARDELTRTRAREVLRSMGARAPTLRATATPAPAAEGR